MKRGIVLFGHGSRDPQWREPMDAVAARIVAASPQMRVVCAFLELQDPALPAAVAQLAAAGAEAVTVVPMFLGTGRHAREDLPRLVAAARERHPGVLVSVVPPVGEWESLLDLLAAEALQRS